MILQILITELTLWLCYHLNPGITLMVSYDANHFLWFSKTLIMLSFGEFYYVFKFECHGERSVAYGVIAAPLPFFTFV